MPRPATGKTTSHNMRIPDELWLPHLAKTVADETTVTAVVQAGMRERIRTPPARELTFSEWPEALIWLEVNYPAWRELADAVTAVTGGLASQEYAGVALWHALTLYPDTPGRQAGLVAGFVLLRAATVSADAWQERFIDSRALLNTVTGILDEYLPRGPQHETGANQPSGAREVKPG